MRVTKAEVRRLRIPFEDGGAGEGLFPGTFKAADCVLLRLETDAGLVGWGEAFGHFCSESVAAMLERAVCPLLIGAEPEDPAAVTADLQRKLHLIGRYGVTTFAISAADIALWDLAAKAEAVSLAELIGGRRRGDLPAYASLVRYGDPALVAEKAAEAVGRGYPVLKLHEITLEAIRAGREGGGDVPLTVDVNCNWSAERVLDWAPALREIGLHWLEEPIFPPEDFATLARLRRETGIPLAAGENLCTAVQYRAMIAAGAVDFVQPSVTKSGGVTETLAARAAAEAAGLTVAQHSPYFGPGYLATLQILAAAEDEELFEYLYVERDRELYRGLPTPEGGRIAVPDGPGLGMEPDPEAMARLAAD